MLARWLGILAGVTLAGTVAVAAAAEPNVTAEARKAFDVVLASRQVQQGLAFLKADDANTLADQNE